MKPSSAPCIIGTALDRTLLLLSIAKLRLKFANRTRGQETIVTTVVL